MTRTEEIVVSGEGFIERRIFVYLQQPKVDNLQRQAYTLGWKRGWMCGFVLGLGLFGTAAIFIWLVTW
jgi:hypothetical protein